MSVVFLVSSFKGHNAVSSPLNTVNLFFSSFFMIGRLAIRSTQRAALRAFTSSATVQNVVFHTDPSVQDESVNVTLIDYLGQRHSVKGRVGQTLVDLCRMHEMDLLEDDSISQGGQVHHVIRSDRWTEDLFGEDVQSSLSHVIVPDATLDLLPAAKHTEETVLDTLDDDVRTTNSRIGACIVLAKELDGCEIYVPDPPPSDLP